MDLSAWTPAAQLALSIGTAAVAFAVYRVQADKLFLEMRNNRIAAIDRYRDALNAQIMYVSTITRANLEAAIGAEKIQLLNAEQWNAELGVKRWFGGELIPFMIATERAILDASQEKIRWCSAERGQAGSYEQVNNLHLAAMKVLDGVLEAANPYIQAGRRGLPLSTSFTLWRNRIWGS